MPETGLDDDGQAGPAAEQRAAVPSPGRPDGTRAVSSPPPMQAAPPAAGGNVERPDWLACLQQACELLWPPPAVVMVEDGRPGWAGRAGDQRQEAAAAGTVSREFTLLGGINRPPLMVPGGRRAAAAALRHHSRPGSPAARLGVKALGLSLAAGLPGPMIRGRVRVRAPAGAGTIEEHLRAVLTRDIEVSMYLGPARANRKPVLEVLTSAGESVGFVKIGVNPLTRSLVRSEHASLVRLGRAGLTKITIPRVLHYDSWHGLDVLVLSALPAWLPPRPLPGSRLATAMDELTRVDGLRYEPLAGSAYLARLMAQLSAADSGPERAALLQALGTLAARAGGEVLGFGCWHGDWSPWNMASTSNGLLVWDWERFATGVPHGFDALHHRLQAEVATARREPRAAASRCAERAPEQLAFFGITAAPARLVAILYLADLAIRYLADRQAQAGAPLGAPGTWLIPAITSAVARL